MAPGRRPPLAALPLPADDRSWDAAADALRAYASAMAGKADGDGDGHRPSRVAAAVDAYAEAAAAAYRSPPEVVAWWRERLDAVLRP